MPKKKTGARKKAEKQKQRQKNIQSGEKRREDLTKAACNLIMVCFKSVYTVLFCVYKNDMFCPFQ